MKVLLWVRRQQEYIMYICCRWSLFFNHLVDDVTGVRPFNQNHFKAEFIDKIGKPFCVDYGKSYTTHTIDDSVAIAKILYKKWRSQMDIFANPAHCTANPKQTSLLGNWLMFSSPFFTALLGLN